MDKKVKVLVALDDDPISSEVVKYVGRMTTGEKSMAICLLHILPPLPPGLREFRGAEDPQIERQLDQEVDLKGKQWTQNAEKAAQAFLQKATSLLTQEGISGQAIDVSIRQLVNHEDLVQDILAAAKEKRCQTVVVGRSSFSWLEELFHHHVADELVRKASGFTVWVVEQGSH